VGRKAQGRALLREDNAHVHLPGHAVPRAEPEPHEARGAGPPGGEAGGGIPRPGKQRAEGTGQPVRLPARRGPVAVQPAERRGTRQGEVQGEGVPGYRRRPEGHGGRLRPQERHGQAEAAYTAAGDHRYPDKRGGHTAQGVHRPEVAGDSGQGQGRQVEGGAAAARHGQSDRGLHGVIREGLQIPLPQRLQDGPHRDPQPGEDAEAGLPEGRRYPLHPSPAQAPLRHPHAQGRRQAGGGGQDTGPRLRGGHLRHLQARGDGRGARGARKIRPPQRGEGAARGLAEYGIVTVEVEGLAPSLVAPLAPLVTGASLLPLVEQYMLFPLYEGGLAGMFLNSIGRDLVFCITFLSFVLSLCTTLIPY